MAAFATPDDLADYLGRDRYTAPGEYRQAVLLLDAASDQIRRWTRQTIDLVSNDVVTLTGLWSPRLVLPERPVVSVASVTVDGTVLAAAGYTLAAADGVLSAPNWGGPGVDVVVTYTHGFAVIPPSVKVACLAVASRVAVSPTAVKSESVAGYSVTYQDGGSAGMAAPEMSSLSWLRRRSLAA